MEHQEVVVGVPELRADRLAVLLLLELVDGRDGDAVVNDLARCLVDEPVVELHLDLGGEADVAAPGLGALERLLDDAGVDALLHEDLGRVPVELVLRPRLVDHPRVRHAQFLGGADHRGAHDGVGEHGAEVRELLLEAHHVARVARLHDVHLHAELLEVLAHRALGGRVELEGLAVERGHVLEQDKHEDVGAVALERVRKHRDTVSLVLLRVVLLDRLHVRLLLHVHQLGVLAEGGEDVLKGGGAEPVAVLLLGFPESLEELLSPGGARRRRLVLRVFRLFGGVSFAATQLHCFSSPLRSRRHLGHLEARGPASSRQRRVSQTSQHAEKDPEGESSRRDLGHLWSCLAKMILKFESLVGRK
mmetsp:Transcript_3748/g.9091  ORF Transcript_3748/g.9091 Transcript_3748/m.9091 type:complete len:361 (-) Transcript_3748:13-1095(-)